MHVVPPSTAARVMDRFERVKKIGEGSFGKALLVKQKDSGKLLVVKEIGISKVSRVLRVYAWCVFPCELMQCVSLCQPLQCV